MKLKVFFSLLVLTIIVGLNASVNAFGFHDVLGAARSLKSVLGESTQNLQNNISPSARALKEKEAQKLKERYELEKEKYSSRSAMMREKDGSKSGDLKERVCENRKELAAKRGSEINKFVEKTITSFDRIAIKVQEYYTQKLLPSGKTISNYDALVSDIASKKALLLAAVETAKTNIPEVNCTKGEVKNDISNFKLDSEKVRLALQEYRKSINNLIKAVRSVADKNE